jgi:hypothetical protein
MGRKALVVLAAVLVWLLLVGSGVALARSHSSSGTHSHSSGHHSATSGSSSHGGSHSHKESSSSHKSTSKKHEKSYCTTCSPDSHGKIKRSPEAKHRFQQSHSCPSTGKTSGKCPGYVIDHVKPLACGGVDDPSNMQWQTTAGAKAKDKTERKQCGR